MSNIEGKPIQGAIQRLKEEIRRLSEQQSAAEKIAALVGMTTQDSRQYKERHSQIRRLAKELADLSSEQGAPS
jgi:predicted RNase H-like nuclease (RuvC/YqgF family)